MTNFDSQGGLPREQAIENMISEADSLLRTHRVVAGLLALSAAILAGLYPFLAVLDFALGRRGPVSLPALGWPIAAVSMLVPGWFWLRNAIYARRTRRLRANVRDLENILSGKVST
jgi:hypothetical protein